MATYYFPSSNQRDVLPAPYLSLDSYNDPPRLPDNIMYPNQASTAVSYSELYNCVEIPSVDSTQHIGHHILDGQQDLQYQELSLSLGMQIPSSMHLPSFQYDYTNAGPTYSPNSRVPDSRDTDSRSKRLRNDEYLSIDLGENARNIINRQCSISPKEVQSVYEPSGLVCTISSSKYLKSAQLLLDEVVNVHEALNAPRNGGVVSEVHESTANSSAELSPAERQDLQSKMTKLSSMLDEVDKRYKQYYHHMKIVETSFEMVAGCGAAKPYTRLALHTISRQFRRLRDAINKQIQVLSQSLGEQCVNSQVLPRLRYVDKQLRQQRIGVVQHHSWRPQRGLPESSVLILRAWLFEHFLHPYV